MSSQYVTVVSVQWDASSPCRKMVGKSGVQSSEYFPLRKLLSRSQRLLPPSLVPSLVSITSKTLSQNRSFRASDTSSKRGCSQRQALWCVWITLWLEMLKDKAAPSFIFIPTVFHVVFSLYTTNIFSLQFTVQFLLYAADI